MLIRFHLYEFYQYWRNIEDESVEKVLSLLTFFLDMEEVKRLASLKDEKRLMKLKNSCL